jgi:hypothetical protein
MVLSMVLAITSGRRMYPLHTQLPPLCVTRKIQRCQPHQHVSPCRGPIREVRSFSKDAQFHGQRPFNYRIVEKSTSASFLLFFSSVDGLLPHEITNFTSLRERGLGLRAKAEGRRPEGPCLHFDPRALSSPSPPRS